MTTALSPLDLAERIGSLPRVRFAALPTALMELPRLARQLGAGSLYIKRDDLTGVGLGGNKSRELEFILAEARSQGCDILIAGGGGEQSNHAVQCAAAANRVGMDSVMVLRRRPTARSNGNLLLDDLMGTAIEWIDGDSEFQNRSQAGLRMHEIAADLRGQGRHPYVLETSLHPLSVVAYADALLEIRAQMPDPSLPARVYVTSEGATLAGLLLGVRLLALPWECIGLDWRPWQQGVAATVLAAMRSACQLLGVMDCPVRKSDLTILPTGGPAYGVGNPASWRALATAATVEGIVLDPVYTAKGLAGTIADLAERPLPGDGRAIFVHTGGVGALFSYEADIRRHAIAPGEPPASRGEAVDGRPAEQRTPRSQPATR